MLSLLRRNRFVAVVAFGLVAVVGILAVGTLASITAEPRRTTPDHVAVGIQEGRLIIFACVDDGIGEAAVARGSRPDGRNVWSVRLAGNQPLQVVPVEGGVPGYDVKGEAVPTYAKSEFNLHGLTDSVGRPLLTSVVTFRPSEMRSGYVKPARGPEQPAEEWAANAGCPQSG